MFASLPLGLSVGHLAAYKLHLHIREHGKKKRKGLIVQNAE